MWFGQYAAVSGDCSDCELNIFVASPQSGEDGALLWNR